MGAFEFVLGILGIVFGYKLIAVYFEQRSARESTPADVAERLTELENRVQVLERIVTDQRFDLRKEFDDLGE